MARLSARERAALPDRAFAYVDSTGRRRLPIVDETHVRNALARFNQVAYESDAARERARRRLLAAARRFRIVPIGFIDREIQVARGEPRVGANRLPTGFVTLLMTDVEGSTSLVAALGDGFVDLLESLRAVHRSATESVGGVPVEARADEYFAAFTAPAAAVAAGIEIQRSLTGRGWAGVDGGVRVRIGLHAGYPTRRGDNYVGMAVNTTSRVCDAAHGGQIVLSGDTLLALTDAMPAGVSTRPLGSYRLRGVPGGPIALHQVVAPGLADSFPRLRC